MRDSSTTEKHTPTTQLFIEGLVQGVGFRPFVYRLAKSLNLTGFVFNQNNGVIIQLQGSSLQKSNFKDRLATQLPKAASLKNIQETHILEKEYKEFIIIKSKRINDSITHVSPDIAICDECLLDMKSQKNRIQYPFTNCTNCGPRFSIIKELPYDRRNTSMHYFTMCNTCKNEYNSITNRRFHAQPIGCNHCGPSYKLINGDQIIDSFQKIIDQLANQINKKNVIAIKGLGGYNICCDAFCPEAIKQIRHIKNRDGKPFAIMFRSEEYAKNHLLLSLTELKALTSWQRPIVVSKSKYDFPKEIAGQLKTIGAFLPYLPIHYQLFEKIKTNAIVLTSCNLKDSPIIIDNNTAIQTFKPFNIPILTNNRIITNRVDDSVVIQIANKTRLIRRSRGYAPSPLPFKYKTEGILATGAELSNTFAIGKEQDIIISQHIGDLKNYETLLFYEQNLNNFKKLFSFSPKEVVCDMHPNYLSTQFAERLSLPTTYVQHHHAHITSTMAEYGIDEKVIGVAFDGTGYGTDGKIWGSEFFITDFQKFKRCFHFDYVNFSGGENVSKNPCLSALGYLFKTYKKSFPKNLKFLKNLPPHKTELILHALEKNINTFESCSVGRLFDAIAALTNICTQMSFNGEAPVLLENCAAPTIKDSYNIKLSRSISWNTVIFQLINELNNNVPVSTISSKFHNTLVKITFKAIQELHNSTGIKKVVLSGGCFQNKILSEKLLDLLNKSGIKAFLSTRIPCNDGGISLGQIAIAAKSRALCV